MYKQSPHPILCQYICKGLRHVPFLHIPKSQSHFPEFLQHGYLKALVLSTWPPMAVLKYGVNTVSVGNNTILFLQVRK